jgi:cobalt/nickel transport system ATP-binding protein
MNAKPLFQLNDVHFEYPGNIVALNNISFTIYPGEFISILGANGAGKSTLLKILDGLCFADRGELMAFQRRISEKTLQDKEFAREFRRKVSMVFQDPEAQLFSPTVWEEVVFGPLQLGISKEEVQSRGNEVLELLDLVRLKDRPPFLLSGGEKKKVAMASVLSLRPQVLLLDEPTNGLDPRSQGNLIDFLLRWSERDKCLVFSTQDLDVVDELATRIIVIGAEHNIIADGPPDRFLSDPDFLLRTNLIHEHSHRHKELVHRHPHLHEHPHQHTENL